MSSNLVGSATSLQSIDSAAKAAPYGAEIPFCDTMVSHTVGGESCPEPWNHSPNGQHGCRTTVSHKRFTGLWRRGAVYQYRVRVPQDVRPQLGRTHVNRSLRTSSYTEAVRLARKAAFEVEQMFDRLRSDDRNETCIILSDVDASRSAPEVMSTRLTAPDLTGNIPVQIGVDALVERIATKLMAADSGVEVADSPTPKGAEKSIKEVYSLYMNDPSAARSVKTILAYDTTYRLLAEIIGETTPISAV